MSANQGRFRVATMARVLGVSPSGYYAWRRRPPPARAQADAELTARVQEIHAGSRGTYGAPRIHAELADAGVAVSRKRVARVMPEAGIAGVSRRRGPRTTRREVQARPAPDRVERCFEADAPNRLWVADITYIPTLGTGLPLFTHTPHDGCPSCALEQLDIIEAMGVNPRLTCIGHLADIRNDPGAELHIELARRGAFLGFDTVGHQITQGDAEKVKMIVSVIDAGYEDHVLLSADFAREAELKANGGAGYSSVVAIFLPKLRYAGVPEETIRKIMVDNPRRFLAFVPKNA